MALTDYLTFAEVRQAIGVEDDELTDDSLSLPMYETELAIALGSVGSTGTLQTDYLTWAAMAVTDRTAPQQNLYMLTRLYAVYSTCIACMPWVALGTIKGESDEKADYTRFGGNVQEAMQVAVTASSERALIALSTAYANYLQLTTPRVSLSYSVAASPSYDPITG